MKREQVNTEVKAIAITDSDAAMIAKSRFASLTNKALALVGIQLDANSGKGENVIRERSKLYGEILSNELWKDDGYKNFQAMVEALFPDKKGTAYMMAGVGARFYADGASDVCKRLGNVLGYTTLDKLKKLSDEELLFNEDKLYGAKDGEVWRISQDNADVLAKSVIAARGKSTDESEGEAAITPKASIAKMYNFTGYAVQQESDKAVVKSIGLENVPDGDNERILSGEVKTHLFKFKDKGFHVTVNDRGEVVVVVKAAYKPEPVKPTMTAFNYDRISRAHAKGMDPETVAEFLDLEVETVRKVYASLDRIKADKAGKASEGESNEAGE